MQLIGRQNLSLVTKTYCCLFSNKETLQQSYVDHLELVFSVTGNSVTVSVSVRTV